VAHASDAGGYAHGTEANGSGVYHSSDYGGYYHSTTASGGTVSHTGYNGTTTESYGAIIISLQPWATMAPGVTDVAPPVGGLRPR
jgi:hypothetical protein